MAIFRMAVQILSVAVFLHCAACAALNPQEVLSPAKHDSTDEKVLEAHFSFSISWRDANGQFTIEESLGSHFHYKNVQGMIALVKGDPKQAHSAEVFVKARSPNQLTLDCLDLTSDKRSLNVTTRPDCAAASLDVHIDIVVAIRPGTLQFGTNAGTRIESNYLDIVVWRELYFETYVMTLRSEFRTVICQETWSFTAHDITIAANHGKIMGNWSLPTSISFTTITGTIDLDLPPKRWSSGPSSLGALTATSKTGRVGIRMPFELDQLSLRNLTTKIVTDTGVINVQLVHGALTHIQTGTGTINATLLPYWAFYEFQGVQFNHITTMCDVCETKLDVLTPVDNYYDIPPLLFSRSKHVAGTGTMALTYPKEWAGTAEWKVGIGSANVTGDDFDIVNGGGLRGKLERRPLGSKLSASVTVGALHMVMKG